MPRLDYFTCPKIIADILGRFKPLITCHLGFTSPLAVESNSSLAWNKKVSFPLIYHQSVFFIEAVTIILLSYLVQTVKHVLHHGFCPRHLLFDHLSHLLLHLLLLLEHHLVLAGRANQRDNFGNWWRGRLIWFGSCWSWKGLFLCYKTKYEILGPRLVTLDSYTFKSN